MGVCCIVFDIDGMLFEFWGGGGVIFFLHFMLFPTFIEKKQIYLLFFWKYCKVPLHLLVK